MNTVLIYLLGISNPFFLSKKDNVDNIVEGIINCKIGGLRIEEVKFSGFIGEPLMIKNETLKAMQRLSGAGKRSTRSMYF